MSTLLWSEEFNAPLSLVTSSNANGRWFGGYPYQGSGLTGKVDEGSANSWNANPNQDFGGTVGKLNPLTVGAVAGATDGSALTLSFNHSTSAQQTACGSAYWGGILISNSHQQQFGYGYYEKRIRYPTLVTGMWPADWQFADVATGIDSALNKGGAEIDHSEIFGADPFHYNVSLHLKTNTFAGTDVNSLYTGQVDTNWHTYGFLWTATSLTWYRDGIQVAQVTGPNATWFAGLKLDLRFNTTWGQGGAPTPYTMQVDYVRYYDSIPAQDTTAPTAPTSLAFTGATSSTVSLTWTAATDNVAVSGYRVVRDGTLVTTVAGTSFTDSGLSAGTTYTYFVQAVDGTGNVSPSSATISTETSSAVHGGPAFPGPSTATWDNVGAIPMAGTTTTPADYAVWDNVGTMPAAATPGGGGSGTGGTSSPPNVLPVVSWSDGAITVQTPATLPHGSTLTLTVVTSDGVEFGVLEAPVL